VFRQHLRPGSSPATEQVGRPRGTALAIRRSCSATMRGPEAPSPTPASIFVFNPVSNVFKPRPGSGSAGSAFRVPCVRAGLPADPAFLNPDLYIFDAEALEKRGRSSPVRHRVPFSTLDLPEAERPNGSTATARSSTVHTLDRSRIGGPARGRLRPEPTWSRRRTQADATAQYMPGYFATAGRQRPPAVKAAARRLGPVRAPPIAVSYRSSGPPRPGPRGADGKPVERPLEPGVGISLKPPGCRPENAHEPSESTGGLPREAQLGGPLQECLPARDWGTNRVAEPRATRSRHARARPPPDQHRRVRPLGRAFGPGPDPARTSRISPAIARPRRTVQISFMGPRPVSPHDGHPLFRGSVPLVGHLLPVPARPDAELEPAAGQVVDASHPPWRGDRIPPR